MLGVGEMELGQKENGFETRSKLSLKILAKKINRNAIKS